MDEPYPPPEPGETPPRSSGWRPWLIAGVAAGVLAVVAIVGVSVLTGSDSSSADPTQVAVGDTTDGSNAQGRPGQGGPGRGTFGTISAIDGTSLTVESSNPSGGATTTVTVETSADTTFTETVEGTVADLAAGDNVVVMGEEDDTGIVASSITDSGDMEAGGGFGGGPPSGRPSGEGTPPSLPDGASVPDGATRPSFPGGDGGGFTAGTISSIDGASFVVETAEGETVTVTTTGETIVQITREITLADLARGDSISAMGDTEDDVVRADTVRVGGSGFPGRRQQP